MSCACARTLACRRGFSSSVCQQDKHSGTCATPVPPPLLPPPPLPFSQGPNRAQSIFVCMHTHLCLACTFVGTHACSAVYTCIHTPLTLCLRDTHKHLRPTRAKARTPRHSLTRKVRTQKVPKIHEVANCTRQGLVHLVYPVMRVSQAPHVLRSLYAYMHPYKHRCAHIHACSRARALSLSLSSPPSLSVPLSLCLTLSPSPLLPVSVSARSLSL